MCDGAPPDHRGRIERAEPNLAQTDHHSDVKPVNKTDPGTDAPRRYRLILACWTLAYVAAAIVVAIGSHSLPPSDPLTPLRRISLRDGLSSTSRRSRPSLARRALPRSPGSGRTSSARSTRWASCWITQTGPHLARRIRRTIELANVAARIKGSGEPEQEGRAPGGSLRFGADCPRRLR